MTEATHTASARLRKIETYAYERRYWLAMGICTLTGLTVGIFLQTPIYGLLVPDPTGEPSALLGAAFLWLVPATVVSAGLTALAFRWFEGTTARRVGAMVVVAAFAFYFGNSAPLWL